jgi:hypothetical protein
MIGLVQLPVSLVGSSGFTGDIPATQVDYAPTAGSPLVGAATVDAALRLIETSLKTLNPLALTNAPTGSTLVWNATTGKLEPTTTPLTGAQFRDALNAGYSTAPTAAFLQKNSSGVWVAVTFLQGMNGGIPGLSNNQVLLWNASTSTWAPGSVADLFNAAAMSAILNAATATSVPAEIIKVTTVNATGNVTSSSPGQVVQQGLASVPASIAGAPVTALLGRNAAGNIVTQSKINLATQTATGNAFGTSLAFGSAVTIATITVAKTGRYIIGCTEGQVFARTFPAATAIDTNKLARIDAIATITDGNSTVYAAQAAFDRVISLTAMGANTLNLCPILLNMTTEPMDLTAGTVINVQYTGTLSNTAVLSNSAFTGFVNTPPVLTLTEVPTTMWQF